MRLKQERNQIIRNEEKGRLRNHCLQDQLANAAWRDISLAAQTILLTLSDVLGKPTPAQPGS